jgi:hypothetical protein
LENSPKGFGEEMRRIIAGTLALMVLSSTCLLAADGAAKVKKAKAKAAAPCCAAAQLQQMQDQLNAQQQSINQLQQQLQQSNQQLMAAQGMVKKADQDAASAQQASSAAQQAANSLNSSVADLKSSTAAMSQSITSIQKDVKELLNPLAIRYKGVTITPGGFIDGGTVWRNHNTNSSLSTNMGQMPLGGEPNTKFTELHMDARNTRLQLKFEAKPNDNVKLTSFVMGDFYGTADPATNENQVNSWLFRIREAWAMAELKNGFFFVGGQMYSLWTPGRRGVGPTGQLLPIAYEGNQPIGLSYERGMQFRFGKKLSNNLSFAFEIEEPELAALTSNFTPTSLLGTQGSGTNFPTGNNMPVACCSQTILVYPGATNQVSPAVAGLPNAPFGTNGTALNVVYPVSGSALQSINGGFAASPYPDLAAKLAWDSPTSTMHFEVRGLARFVRSGEALNGANLPINTAGSQQTAILNLATPAVCGASASPTGTNAANCFKSVDMNTTEAWGVGISAVVPVTKKADFVLNASYGAGAEARYNPGGGSSADFTIGVDKSGTYTLKPVKGGALYGGLEMHPSPKLDLYLLGGNEYYQRQIWGDPFGGLNSSLTSSVTSVSQCGSHGCMGYGLPSKSTAAPSVTSPNRDLWEGTFGYIYKFWTGSFGTFQTMGEYQYIHRAVWQDLATPSSLFKGNLSVVDVAVRYVLP